MTVGPLWVATGLSHPKIDSAYSFEKTRAPNLLSKREGNVVQKHQRGKVARDSFSSLHAQAECPASTSQSKAGPERYDPFSFLIRKTKAAFAPTATHAHRQRL